MSFTLTSSDGGTDWVAIVQAIAEGLGEWAWPVVTIVFLSIYRPQIGRLIDRARKAGAGDVGLEFGEETEKATALAEVTVEEEVLDELAAPIDGGDKSIDTAAGERIEPASKAEPSTAEHQSEANRQTFENAIGDVRQKSQDGEAFAGLLELSPALAVSHRYFGIEGALADLADALRIERGISFPLFLKRLRATRVLEPSTILLLEQLRKLRNAAVNGAVVQVSDATTFLENADVATRAIRAATDRVRPRPPKSLAQF